MNPENNKLATAIRWIILFIAWSVPLVFCAWLHLPYRLPKIVLFKAAIALGIFLWAVEMAIRKEIVFLRSITTIAILAFLVISALSIAFAINSREAWNTLAYTGSGAALYLLLTGHVRERRFFSYLFNGTIIIGLVVFAYAVLQYRGIDISALRGKTIGTESTIGVSTLGNVNFIAEYIAIIINFALFMYLAGTTITGDTIYSLATLVLFASLIITRSRSGWISLAIALVCSFLLMFRYMRERRMRLYRRFAWRKSFILLMLASIVFFMANRAKPFADNLTFEIESLFTEAPERTNIQRVFIWQRTLEMIGDHPMTGVGLGNFKIEYPRYRSVVERELSGGRTRLERVHNDYLQIWAETGIFGLAAFLWIATISLLNGKKVLRSRTGPIWKAATIALLGGLITILTNALFNFPLINPAPTVYFWVIVASLAVISSSDRLKRNRIDPHLGRLRLRSTIARCSIVIAGLAILCATLFFQWRALFSNYHLQRGREHYYYARWPEAKGSFSMSLSWEPDNRIAHHYLANTYNLLGEHDLAIEEYGKTLSLHPNYEAAHYGLGSAFLGKGDIDKAAQSYRKAIDLRPNYTLAYVQLGKTFEQVKRFREALQAYNEGAIVEERMISQNPDNWNAQFRRASLIESMGNVYMKMGKYKQAVLRYKESAKDMASIYYGLDISSKVKDVTEFDLKTANAYTAIYTALGAAYASDGQIGKAVAVWHEVLKIDPDNEPARFNLQKAGLLKIKGRDKQ